MQLGRKTHSYLDFNGSAGNPNQNYADLLAIRTECKSYDLHTHIDWFTRSCWFRNRPEHLAQWCYSNLGKLHHRRCRYPYFLGCSLFWCWVFVSLGSYPCFLVGVKSISFFINREESSADAGKLMYGWTVPSMPAYALTLAVGTIGAFIMPHNLYLHSGLVISLARYTNTIPRSCSLETLRIKW